MRNRYTQRPDHWDYTSQQLVRFARLRQGDCLHCSANRGDNQRGHLAKWGKKVAKKHEYATGKRRNDNQFKWARMHHGFNVCDYYDAHYDEKYKPKPRRKEKMELTNGDARYLLDEYIKYLKKNRNVIADTAARNLNRYSWAGASTSLAELGMGSKDVPEFSVYITFTRKKPFYRYFPPES